MATDLRAELLGDSDLVRFTTPSLVWDLRSKAKALYDALAAAEPAIGSVFDLLSREVPVQTRWSFGPQGPFSRPDRHVRAFYLHLDKLQSVSGGRGCVAIKGSEPVSDNFHHVVKRMGEMWNVFSWSIGGGGRHILEDWTYLNQLERFPLCEGKPPGVHPLWDAEEEATCALELQTAYLGRFGKLAKIPTPLFVYRWPDEIRDRAWSLLKPELSEKTSRLVESQIADGLGAFIYYYPGLPIRAMHVRGGDVGPEVSYAARHQALSALTDPAAAVDGWIKLAAEFLALGWVPTDPANFSRGYCVMPQNMVIDGGIVDVNSLRAVSSFRTKAELEFAVRQTARELTQSVCWFMIGTEAGLERFQHIFLDTLVYVWSALRKEAEAAGAPPEILGVLAGGDSVYKSVDRVFRNFYGVASFRPQDPESNEYAAKK